MPRPIARHIQDILAQYSLNKDEALWDCHGTWVMYHRYCEIIAAKAGVKFDAPQIVEAKTAEKVAVICVTGRMGDRAEWSFGEAAPSNNKNAYPYAMAEKRAKDRVILKLVGLAGFVYSEEEADDFKESKPDAEPADEVRGGIGLFYPGKAVATTAPSIGRWLDLYDAATAKFGHEAMWTENESTLMGIQNKASKEGRQDIVDRINRLYEAAEGKAA